MATRKRSYARRIRKQLKDDGIPIDSLLDGLLEELERLEDIRHQIYTEFKDSDSVLEEYTNKAGATNMVITAAVKEYKMYSQKFNDLTKTLERMLSSRVPDKPKEVDPLMSLNGRDRL